VVGVVVKQ